MVTLCREAFEIGLHKKQARGIFKKIILFRSERKPILSLFAHFPFKNSSCSFYFRFADCTDVFEIVLNRNRKLGNICFGDYFFGNVHIFKRLGNILFKFPFKIPVRHCQKGYEQYDQIGEGAKFGVLPIHKNQNLRYYYSGYSNPKPEIVFQQK